MPQELSIGIIGDYNEKLYASHPATNAAIEHAADHLGLKASIIWLPTPSLVTPEGRRKLELFDALWASPGSPYESMEGALLAIKQARLLGKPFFGT